MGHLLFLLGHVSKRTMHKYNTPTQTHDTTLPHIDSKTIVCYSYLIKGMRLSHRNLVRHRFFMRGYWMKLERNETGTLHVHVDCTCTIVHHCFVFSCTLSVISLIFSLFFSIFFSEALQWT